MNKDRTGESVYEPEPSWSIFDPPPVKYFNPCCCCPIAKSGKILSLVNIALCGIGGVGLLIGAIFSSRVTLHSIAYGIVFGTDMITVVGSFLVLVIPKTAWPNILSAAMFAGSALARLGAGILFIYVLVSPPAQPNPKTQTDADWLSQVRTLSKAMIPTFMLAMLLEVWFCSVMAASAAYIRKSGGLGHNAVWFETYHNEVYSAQPEGPEQPVQSYSIHDPDMSSQSPPYSNPPNT